MKATQNTKRNLFFVPLILIVSGCAQLSHLDQLLTLKAISDNRDLQHKFVKKQDKNFSALLVAIKDNSIQKFTAKKQFLKQFGPPVIAHPDVWDGKPCELWLYRYAVKYLSSEKVYLYFDEQENLLSWERVEPEKQEVSRR